MMADAKQAAGTVSTISVILNWLPMVIMLGAGVHESQPVSV
jgi:hypothetical protein